MMSDQVTIRVCGACVTGDCDCAQYDFVSVGEGEKRPPFHDGCTCIVLPDDEHVIFAIEEIDKVTAQLIQQMLAQGRVADAVERQGYRAGWTAKQFAARAVVKLAAELGELSAAVLYPETAWGDDTRKATLKAGAMARELFSCEFGWPRVGLSDIKQIKSEAADLQVMLFALAGAIEEITGERFDLVGTAVAKAERDGERGVR